MTQGRGDNQRQNGASGKADNAIGVSADLLKSGLANGRAQDVCAELGLSEDADGLFVSADKQLLLFPVGAYYPWQKADLPLQFHWLGGAPLAFSFSADGHDAAAVHLGPQSQLHQIEQHALDANVWHTGESLGNWSLLQRDGLTAEQADNAIERAADDWFPTPRQAMKGPQQAG